jgi:hypothetical protein
MEAKTLKLLFDNGGLASAKVEPYPMMEGSWTLLIVLASGEKRPVTRVRTKQAKVYKSVKAVLTDIKKIGFNCAELCL